MAQKIFIYDKASGLPPEAFLVLANFDQNYFPQPWDVGSWNDLFLTSSERLLISSYDEGELSGFALFNYSSADSFAHLLKIVTNPSKRGKGIGNTLLSEGLRVLKERGVHEFFLEVEENNLSAISLYQKFNFKVIHKKKHFYSNGASALIMTASFITA